MTRGEQPMRVLLATGDPLLDQSLAEGPLAVAARCETAADCLSCLGTCGAEVVVLAAAVEWRGEELAALLTAVRLQVPQARLVFLTEGEEQPGALPEVAGAGGARVLHEAEWSGELLYRQLQEFALPGPAWDAAPEPRQAAPLTAPGAATALPPTATPPAPPAPPTVRVASVPGYPFATAGPATRIPAPAGNGARWMAAPPGRLPQPSAPPRILRQKVITAWGGKPGAGRSTCLLAMADLLSQLSGVRVCLLDLNSYNSSLAPLLGKEQEPGSWPELGEVMASGATDPSAVRRCLVPVRANWDLLTGPAGQPEWIEALLPCAIDPLLEILRADYDFILIDIACRPEPLTQAVLRAARVVLVMMTPDFPDVLDTTRTFARLAEAGVVDRERCRLVLSRWVETPELPAADVAACLDLPVAGQLPLAPEEALAASRQGRPVTRVAPAGPRPLANAVAAVTAAVADLAPRVPGRQTLATQLWGWLGR